MFDVGYTERWNDGTTLLNLTERHPFIPNASLLSCSFKYISHCTLVIRSASETGKMVCPLTAFVFAVLISTVAAANVAGTSENGKKKVGTNWQRSRDFGCATESALQASRTLSWQPRLTNILKWTWTFRRAQYLEFWKTRMSGRMHPNRTQLRPKSYAWHTNRGWKKHWFFGWTRTPAMVEHSQTDYYRCRPKLSLLKWGMTT